jgi:hypothetical protein
MHIIEETLEARSQQASRLEQVSRRDLRSGDWILVTTSNSRYTICRLDDESYLVSGGWFDRKGLSPQKISIHGCTWGGSAIKHDIVAAQGLFLEFGNRVLTTRIQQVRVIRRGESETVC